MESIILLRFISFVAILALPIAAVAQPVPNGTDLASSYEALINDLTRSNVSLRAQALADKREIDRLHAEAAKAQAMRPKADQKP